MGRRLQLVTLVVMATTAQAAKDGPELPPCPTNIQYFPQTLPMHCRMPVNGMPQLSSQGGSFPEMRRMANVPTFAPPFYQSLPPDKAPQPIPFPIPAGFPAPIFQGPLVPQSAPAHKLPIIVMPFYSPDKVYQDKHPSESSYAKPKPDTRPSDTEVDDASCDTDMSTEEDSDDSAGGGSSSGWWKPKKSKKNSRNSRNSRNYRRSGNTRRSGSNKRKHSHDKDNMLTPLIQYVTKDGYVIFEKEISKAEATDWLNDNNKKGDEIDDDAGEGDGDVMNKVDESEYPKLEVQLRETKDPGASENQDKTTTRRAPTAQRRLRAFRNSLKNPRIQATVAATRNP